MRRGIWSLIRNVHGRGPRTLPELQAAIQEQIRDDYEVLEHIGQGGMADVFRARHLRGLGDVAVKVLAEKLAAQETFVERFLQEAKTVRDLEGHPNVITIKDVNSVPDRHLYWIIMSYIEGQDVCDYADRRALPPDEALSIIRPVAEALAHAAKRGIIHRDIKPSNIRIDRTGRVVVLDFGIAKDVDDKRQLTLTGVNPGTLDYMAPEQRENRETSHRSDLYSLGLVFGQLLLGIGPDDFRYDLKREIAQVAPEIQPILKRLLQRFPDDRYASAEELISDLAAAQQVYPPVKLVPKVDASVSTFDGRRKTKPVRKRRWLLIAGAAPLVALAALAPRLSSGLPHEIEDPHGKMLLVPAGKFVFGDDSVGSPYSRQQLTLPAFYIDATETSNAQYAAFTTATGRTTPAAGSSSGKLPVVDVSLADAEAYCDWAGRRLPTEQEWEKAARGPAGAIYPWGAQPLPSPGKLVPVDSDPDRRSWVGAWNLSGNAFEWTASRFPVTPEYLEDMKVKTGRTAVSSDWRSIKGGTYLKDNERFLRSYMRRGWPADQPNPALGFRCVKDAQ